MQIIGAPLAAGLLYLDGKGGLQGWQWIFIGMPLSSVYCLVQQLDPRQFQLNSALHEQMQHALPAHMVANLSCKRTI